MGDTGRIIAGGLLIAGGLILIATGNWQLGIMAASYGANLLVQPDVQGLEDRQGGMLENRLSPNEPLPVIYGQCRVGPALADVRVDPASPENKRLVLVAAYCHGSQDGSGIEGFQEVWFEDRQAIAALSSPDILDPFDAPVEGQGVRHLEWYPHVGTTTQTVEPRLTTLFPYEWGSGADGADVCYAVFELWFNPDIFPFGIPRLLATIKGNKVWDPRDSTWKWSTNPALCIRDYLTSPVYGLGVDEANLDEQSFIDIANYCDELVTDPEVSGGTQKRFECNGWVDTARSTEQNLIELCSSCNGQVINEGNVWRLHVRRVRTSSGFKINPDNTVAGQWSFTVPGIKATPNIVRATFIDPLQNFQPDYVEWPEPGQSNPYLTTDNGYERRLDIDLPFTDNRGRAQQIAMTLLKEARESITVTCVLHESALQIRVGELVEVTQPMAGWTDKLFDVAALLIEPNGNIRAILVEYEPTVYNLDEQFPSPIIPDTGLPDPFFVEPIPSGTLVLTTGTRRPYIRVTWDPSPSEFVTHYEVQGKLETEATFKNWPTRGERDTTSTTDNEAWVGPVQDNESWIVRVRAVNVFGVKSAWTDEFHTVDIIGPAEFTTVVTPEDGAITYDITYQDDCQYVYVYSQQTGPSAGGPLPPEATEYLAGRLENGVTNTIRIATTVDFYRTTKMVGWTWDGLRGETETYDTQATASGAGPSAPPSGLSQASATADTIIASWTNGDATAQTAVWVDGVLKGYADPAATTFTVTGLSPSTDYDVEIAHYKNGQWDPANPPRVGPVVMSTTSLPQLDAPTAFLAYGANCGKGDPMAAFQWTMGANAGPANAKTRIQRSATGAWGGEEVDVLVTSAGATSAATYTPTSGSFTHRARHERLGWADSNWTYYSAFATYGDCEPL